MQMFLEKGSTRSCLSFAHNDAGRTTIRTLATVCTEMYEVQVPLQYLAISIFRMFYSIDLGSNICLVVLELIVISYCRMRI